MAQKFYCLISPYLTFLFYYCNYVIYLFTKKFLIRSWWTGPPRLALAIRGPVNMLKYLFLWNKELLLLLLLLQALERKMILTKDSTICIDLHIVYVPMLECSWILDSRRTSRIACALNVLRFNGATWSHIWG